MKKNYKIVNSLEDFKEMIKYIEAGDPDEIIAYDIETNSIIEKVAVPIGIGITANYNEGWYLPIRYWDNEKKQLFLMDFIEDEDHERVLVETFHGKLKGKRLIMHNGVYDIACIWHYYKIDLIPDFYADTIAMKHTIEEEPPFALKLLALKWQRELGIPLTEVANQDQLELKDNVISKGGKWTKKQKDIYMGDMPIVGKYCIADVDLTLRLFDYLEERLEDEGLLNFFYDKEVMPLYKKATIPMKINGLYCDLDYFKRLKNEVEYGIMNLRDEIFALIKEDIKPRVKELLDKKVKPSRSGQFAEKVLRYYRLPVPTNTKTGKPTFAKKALQYLSASFPDHEAVLWLTDTSVELPEDVEVEIQKEIFVEKNPNLPHVFNLKSKDDIRWLLYEKMKLTPVSFSKKTDKEELTKDTLPHHINEAPWIEKLIELNKENKVLSTYIDAVLERNVDGWVYPSMLQHGTTSGRYSCGGEGSPLNLQTLPRDDKRIKKGFICPPGYKIVNADFSSLEPRVFAWVSNDPGLKAVYWDNLDLYSKIAIDMFGLSQYSAREEDPNFLKKLAPDERQKTKVFTLAVPYGAGAGRIAGLMNIDYQDAQNIINTYLDTYPDLKQYMEDQLRSAIKNGYVTTKFGRVRHLPLAKELYQRFGEAILNKKKMALKFGGHVGQNIFKEFNDINKNLEAYDRMEGKYDAKLLESKRNDAQRKIKEIKRKWGKAIESENQMIYKTGEEGVTIYYKFRNIINNARNFPIQGTAAHIANASMIKLADSLEEAIKKEGLDAKIILQVHDEITLYAADKDVERTKELLKDAMENNIITKQIDIPILAEPCVALTLASAK